MKFAVAVFDMHSGSNTIYLIDAETPEKALIESLRLSVSDSEEDYQVRWRANMEGKSVEEIIALAINGDQVLSLPEEL